MSRPRAGWPVFLTLAGAVVLADQASKAWVTAAFEPASPHALPGTPGGPTRVVGDLLRIALGFNDGGIFGLLGASATLLGLVSILVIAAIVFVQARQGRSTVTMSAAFGLLLGGAVGNLFDRLRLGHVVDWVDVGWGDLRWYTFNVADAAISCSILMLLVTGLIGNRRLAPRAPSHAGAPAGSAGR